MRLLFCTVFHFFWTLRVPSIHLASIRIRACRPNPIAFESDGDSVAHIEPNQCHYFTGSFVSVFAERGQAGVSLIETKNEMKMSDNLLLTFIFNWIGLIRCEAPGGVNAMPKFSSAIHSEICSRLLLRDEPMHEMAIVHVVEWLATCWHSETDLPKIWRQMPGWFNKKPVETNYCASIYIRHYSRIHAPAMSACCLLLSEATKMNLSRLSLMFHRLNVTRMMWAVVCNRIFDEKSIIHR